MQVWTPTFWIGLLIGIVEKLLSMLRVLSPRKSLQVQKMPMVLLPVWPLVGSRSALAMLRELSHPKQSMASMDLTMERKLLPLMLRAMYS